MHQYFTVWTPVLKVLSWGTWVAQSIKHLTSAQVMVSWFMSLNPTPDELVPYFSCLVLSCLGLRISSHAVLQTNRWWHPTLDRPSFLWIWGYLVALQFQVSGRSKHVVIWWFTLCSLVIRVGVRLFSSSLHPRWKQNTASFFSIQLSSSFGISLLMFLRKTSISSQIWCSGLMELPEAALVLQALWVSVTRGPKDWIWI